MNSPTDNACCSGWSVWRPVNAQTGKREFVWVACADCNDDALKPKPDLCEGCGETADFCPCEKEIS